MRLEFPDFFFFISYPPTDPIQASQVSPSFPSPPVSQRKRKREEALAEELSGRSIDPLQSSKLNHLGRTPKAPKPSIDCSSRCDTLSRQRRDRELKANSQQLVRKRSPSSSFDSDRESRKQFDRFETREPNYPKATESCEPTRSNICTGKSV